MGFIEIVIVDGIVIDRLVIRHRFPFRSAAVGVDGGIADRVHPAVGGHVGGLGHLTVAGVIDPVFLGLGGDLDADIAGLLAGAVIVEDELQLGTGGQLDGEAVPAFVGGVGFYGNTGPGAAVFIVFQFAPGTAFADVDGHVVPSFGVIKMGGKGGHARISLYAEGNETHQ